MYDGRGEIMAAFEVSINEFEGPLDLMLHLIKEKQLDLFDLDLTILTDQYISYLKAMEHLHLEIASEYLSELAGLVEYKSKRLLPKDTSELEDNYEEDAREQLVMRLIEYQKFKEVSKDLLHLNEERALQFDRPQEEIAAKWIKESKNPSSDAQGSTIDLIKAMNHCIRRFKVMQPLQMKVARKDLSVEDRTIQLKVLMSKLPDIFTLDDLCVDCEDLHTVIVTFLAVLDLIRVGYLLCETDMEKIWLKRGATYAK